MHYMAEPQQLSSRGTVISEGLGVPLKNVTPGACHRLEISGEHARICTCHIIIAVD